MFTERLKALRKEKNLTQKEIAIKFNITQPAYQQWESGKIKPSADTLDKFAKFFNVSTDYLLGKTNIKNPDEVDLTKLDEAIENSVGFNGKPVTPEEKENIKEALILYLESLKK